MSDKKCSTCGSEMGLGAITAENVKVQYECWCGEVEYEYFSDDEMQMPATENNQPVAASAAF